MSFHSIHNINLCRKSIEQVLASHFATVNSDDDCAACLGVRKTIETKLTKPPSRLLLHVQRFDRSNRKGTAALSFSSVLEFQGSRYSLTAVTEHQGKSRYTGRHIVFVKNPWTDW